MPLIAASLLNSPRNPPAEFLGILESNGEMKKASPSATNLSTALMIKEKFVVKSVTYPKGELVHDIRHDQHFRRWSCQEYLCERPSGFVYASPCKIRLLLSVLKLGKLKEIGIALGSSNKKKMKN